MEDLKELEKYVESNIDTLVSEVSMLEGKSEDEILGYVGKMLMTNGYTVSGNVEGNVIVPAEPVNLQRSFAVFFPADNITKGMTAAAVEGKSFKKRLKYAVCTNETLIKLFGDNANTSVRDIIKKGLPTVVTVLGGSIGGFWLAVAAAALALLLKLGYKAYCDGYRDENAKA